MVSAIKDRLPLSALLSQTLVAFIIEFDNEFEHLVPHRTTNHGSTGGSGSVPWLVSMAMWSQLMQFVPAEGIAAGKLYRRTALSLKALRFRLRRMSRWGYVRVAERFVRPTPGGLKALEAWRPLTAVIENRWRKRFGADRVDQLCERMQALVRTLAAGYPDCLPILGYELLSDPPALKPSSPDGTGKAAGAKHTLPTLLSKLLLAFAVEFERDSGLSIAVGANLFRLARAEGVRVRDISRLSGVSKEAVAMLVRRAQECRLGIVEKSPQTGNRKTFVLTPDGQRARNTYQKLVLDIEMDWKARCPSQQVEKLRALLESMVGEGSADSLLFKGLEPYPEGWRASVPRLEQLPHYPMVLHRGGFPDGS
jgi:DNA-binding MarR family transcriptional regulator